MTLRRNRRRPASMHLPRWFFWATWLMGPASCGLAFAYCLTWPWMCDGPNVMLVNVMILTHLFAGAMTLGLVANPGPHRGSVEFWLLMLYWAGIAGWLLSTFVAPSIDPTFPWACTLAAGAAVLLIPLAGGVRWLLSRGA